MPTLTITQGLPGSGKSTWARDRVRQIRTEGHQAGIVGRDMIRDMLGVDHYGNDIDERTVTLVQHSLVECLLLANIDVVVDDTNLNPVCRDRLRNLATRVSANFSVVDFTWVALEICIERDKRRPPRVPFGCAGAQVGEHVIRDLNVQHLAQ
ncbi:AAA family ATPase [Frankia sp. Cr2]|uniref:AAA family ATPase n=1 Tax=Frankia sp. Cr2 TaxID=3073932 RepID=UPI003A10356D